MGRSRDVADALAKLPEFIPLLEEYGPLLGEFGPTNEAQIDARVAETVFGYQRNSKFLAAARSGSSFGEDPSSYRHISAQDMPQFWNGDRQRYIGETFDYPGRSIYWHQSATEPMNGVRALQDALDFRVANGNGRRHVSFTGYGWQFASDIPATYYSRAVVNCPGGIAPNAPPMAFFHPGARVFDFSGVNSFRLTGVFHAAHVALPASTLASLNFSGGTSHVYIDELVIENAHTVLNFDDCSDIYIRRVIAPGATRKIVATAASQRVRIGEWIGPGTVTVASGGDVTIGTALEGLLPGLSALTPSANKAVIWNSAGAPSYIDWILAGSFTPTIEAATPGDLSVAYSTATGTYYKRGRQVEIAVVLVFTPTYTTASGNLRIGGLPFVTEAGSSLSLLNFSSTSAFTWPNTATQIFAAPQASQFYAHILGQKSGSTTATAAMSIFPSGTQQTLRFRGVYSTVS